MSWTLEIKLTQADETNGTVTTRAVVFTGYNSDVNNTLNEVIADVLP